MSEIVRDEGISIIVVDPACGSLGEPGVRAFRDELLQLIDTADPPLVLIDLSQTTYIGSMFIGALISGWKRAGQRGARIALCCLNAECTEVLEVSNLNSIWDLYADRQAAKPKLLEPAIG